MPAADAVIDSRVDLGVPQYRLTTIMLIWAAAALPMAVLGWLVVRIRALNASVC